MLNSVNKVDYLVEGYEKAHAAGVYFGTSSTSPELVEVKEGEAPTFDKEEQKLRVIWRPGLRVPPESDAGSSFVLSESYVADFLADPLGSPFDVLEETLPDRKKARQIKKIKRIIKSIIDKSNIHFARKLVARLNFLYEAVLEDPEEGHVPPESLDNFIKFLQNTTNLKYPDVVLTPTNEISAQWRTAPNRHFAVVFQATGEARFVIFTPNPKDPAKIDRLSGITSVDTLMEVVAPHGVLDWAAL